MEIRIIKEKDKTYTELKFSKKEMSSDIAIYCKMNKKIELHHASSRYVYYRIEGDYLNRKRSVKSNE